MILINSFSNKYIQTKHKISNKNIWLLLCAMVIRKQKYVIDYPVGICYDLFAHEVTRSPWNIPLWAIVYTVNAYTMYLAQTVIPWPSFLVSDWLSGHVSLFISDCYMGKRNLKVSLIRVMKWSLLIWDQWSESNNLTMLIKWRTRLNDLGISPLLLGLLLQ